jgi:hypothetical protein
MLKMIFKGNGIKIKMNQEELTRLTITLTNQVLEMQKGLSLIAKTLLELQTEVHQIKEKKSEKRCDADDFERFVQEVNILREEKKRLMEKYQRQ